MDETEIWNSEERLWLEGAESYSELVSQQCVMAFPAPVGIMKGIDIARSLEGAPRWSRISMSRQTVGRPDDRTLVLAYLAEGDRPGAALYRAYCTSTYRFDGKAWRLVQHQQTPVV